jgi:hypothetical protein
MVKGMRKEDLGRCWRGYAGRRVGKKEEESRRFSRLWMALCRVHVVLTLWLGDFCQINQGF